MLVPLKEGWNYTLNFERRMLRMLYGPVNDNSSLYGEQDTAMSFIRSVMNCTQSK
jgi:hypothetical protein